MVCVRDILLKGNSISFDAILTFHSMWKILVSPPSYINEATWYGQKHFMCLVTLHAWLTLSRAMNPSPFFHPFQP